MLLDREEYIEQAWFFKVLGERMNQSVATQDLLDAVKQEILSTTKLPLAIDFLAAELRLTGQFATAMSRLKHYFTPFQTFIIGEAESERSKFDFNIAVQVIEREAKYRAAGATPQGAFLYQFETLCRNRLGYDKGLSAMAGDPVYDDVWKRFVLDLRRKIGMVDISDLLYVHSELYVKNQRQRAVAGSPAAESAAVLFGEKEGKIALANRRKDPLLLFAAMQRHLNYPAVPVPKKADESANLVPLLLRRVERMEMRIKLLEEEQRGGIDITKFYKPPDESPAVDLSEDGPA